jgi:hypothetical protein
VLNDNLKFDNEMIDFMDLDSDKGLQYQKNSGVMSLIYGQESKKLFKFEMEIAKNLILAYLCHR